MTRAIRRWSFLIILILPYLVCCIWFCVRVAPVPVVSQIPVVHMPVDAFPNAKDKFSLGWHKFQSFKFRFVVHVVILIHWGIWRDRRSVCWGRVLVWRDTPSRVGYLMLDTTIHQSALVKMVPM